MTTPGCATVDMTLRRNGLGQLGFHVHPDGSVAEVEEYGFAWQAGLRRGSRLLEVCKVAAVALSHEQMIDLLRTSVTVTVNVFGQPRLRASLRDLRSPRRLPKSSIEDDLKRLILMDNSCPEAEPAPEKQDKVFLQAEVASLRQNNRRLQQESSSAARQLRRFARIFSGAAPHHEP
ncbi:Signal-induced proliferation-associated 1-like protein 3 [Lonchura striata]|uniref:Signal-induced proliferation-associated 1-like protein 3 n=1 Tax=Lonchura striata TaxID=40157 RepID=A0A218U8S5_9PASE|nr:Signal-induced proliferation-associated 1-like protein 3 [Lonchura striata domestica]